VGARPTASPHTSSSMLQANLNIAFGARGVAKLVESLSLPAETGNLAVNLMTLNGLLSSQENKMSALANDGAVLTVLTTLLASTESEVRRQAGLAIASLTLVYQGRLAAATANTVPALRIGLSDSVVTVRAACASALLSLSSSRDGCSEMMRTEGLVSKLTGALDDASRDVLTSALGALSNLVRLDLGIDEALESGVVKRLATLIDPKQRVANLLETGLQALWNLANTPNGKEAAIDAGLLDILAQHVRHGSPNVRRLASGCIMAITINKDGKYQSKPCAEPLLELLFDPNSDFPTVRDCVGALKNMTEYPKLRKQIDKWLREHGGERDHIVEGGTTAQMQEMFERVIYDHKQWPASYRYQHQNIAPGGYAAEDEANTRATWGYPQPFASDL